jgi:hypothetical protein
MLDELKAEQKPVIPSRRKCLSGTNKHTSTGHVWCEDVLKESKQNPLLDTGFNTESMDLACRRKINKKFWEEAITNSLLMTHEEDRRRKNGLTQIHRRGQQGDLISFLTEILDSTQRVRCSHIPVKLMRTQRQGDRQNRWTHMDTRMDRK